MAEVLVLAEHTADGEVKKVTVELLTAARALDLRAPLSPAPATAAVAAGLRTVVTGPGPDRFLAPEIEAAVGYVTSGGAVRADDNHEALKVRLDAYREQTAPLIDYYRSRNVLKSVDGLQPVDSVTEQIFQIMERRQRAISNTVAEQEKSGRPG